MSAVKDLLIEVQEEFIESYMHENPGVTWTEAYDATQRLAYVEAQDRLYQLYGYT